MMPASESLRRCQMGTSSVRDNSPLVNKSQVILIAGKYNLFECCGSEDGAEERYSAWNKKEYHLDHLAVIEMKLAC